MDDDCEHFHNALDTYFQGKFNFLLVFIELHLSSKPVILGKMMVDLSLK